MIETYKRRMCQSYLASIFIFLVCLPSLTVCSNILVLCPSASYSHQQPFILISQALLERKHSVTLFTCNPEKINTHENLTIVDGSVSYDYVRKIVSNDLQSRMDQWSNIRVFHSYSAALSSVLWESQGTQDFLRHTISTNRTFDLMIMETWSHSSFLGLLDMIGNPPLIQMSTAHAISFLTWPFGNPENPAYVPIVWGANTDSMTFWQRCINTAGYLYYYYYFFKVMDDEEKVRHKYLDKKYIKRSLREIFMDNSRGSFISSFDSRITGYSRPVLPQIVEVGPLHLVQPKPLKKELQDWLNGAQEGVIYFSLGSNVRSSSMGEARRKAFLKAFSKFPQYRVLWKWETEDMMEEQPKNMLLKKWMPQQDVLAHPKVKLFIMQGGLQSLQEAFHYGKKLICMPMFGDQDMNCHRIAKIKTGVTIEFEHLNEEMIYNALKAVLEDPVYEENMQYYSFLSRDTPMGPIQKSMWWIEYVLRHKGVQHLHSEAADLSLIQYYLLDVIAFALFLLMGVVGAVYMVVRRLLRQLISKERRLDKFDRKKKTK